MIDPEHALSISRQAEELEISRSTVYYQPRPVSDADLFLMRRIDELHMNYPFAGSRMLRDMLSLQGLEVGRRHVRSLMRRMGIETLYRKPNTSKPAPGHKIYPYLLRGLAITRPNQVWSTDITYIPMARGFVYLAAVVDWFSRRVLAWRLSVTMDTSFCIEALEEAIEKHGRPEIFNTDQGAQFTSEAFTGLLKEEGIQISMDGKGRWADNVFVERLWRSLKYEHGLAIRWRLCLSSKWCFAPCVGNCAKQRCPDENSGLSDGVSSLISTYATISQILSPVYCASRYAIFSGRKYLFNSSSVRYPSSMAGRRADHARAHGAIKAKRNTQMQVHGNECASAAKQSHKQGCRRVIKVVARLRTAFLYSHLQLSDLLLSF